MAAPFKRLPSYSIYLKNTYRDLMADLGVLQSPHCAADNGGGGKSTGVEQRLLRTSGDDDLLESGPMGARQEVLHKEEEQSYCKAYNLILTSRWMMAVPRSAHKSENLVSVNGLGERDFEFDQI